MFMVRCGMVFLALLACTQARQKCTTAQYGQQSGYEISFATIKMYSQSIDLHLTFEEAGCNDPVGSWAEVCADDDANPEVWFSDVYTLHIERNGANGGATVESGGFCRQSPYGHGLGAAHPTPKVVPVKGKKPK